MTRFTFITGLALSIFLSVGATSYSQTEGGRKNDTTVAKSTEQRGVYYCPMHPDVTSDKPGTCSKCGMNLVLREEKKAETEDGQTSQNLPARQKIQQAQSLLAEAKKELAQEGKYKCCIKDPCDRCALDHQSCPCADEVKAGKAVCPDCYAGWQRGDGVVKGVDAKKVKSSVHSHKH